MATRIPHTLHQLTQLFETPSHPEKEKLEQVSKEIMSSLSDQTGRLSEITKSPFEEKLDLTEFLTTLHVGFETTSIRQSAQALTRPLLQSCYDQIVTLAHQRFKPLQRPKLEVLLNSQASLGLKKHVKHEELATIIESRDRSLMSDTLSSTKSLIAFYEGSTLELQEQDMPIHTDEEEINTFCLELLQQEKIGVQDLKGHLINSTKTDNYLTKLHKSEPHQVSEHTCKAFLKSIQSPDPVQVTLTDMDTDDLNIPDFQALTLSLECTKTKQRLMGGIFSFLTLHPEQDRGGPLTKVMRDTYQEATRTKERAHFNEIKQLAVQLEAKVTNEEGLTTALKELHKESQPTIDALVYLVLTNESDKFGERLISSIDTILEADEIFSDKEQLERLKITVEISLPAFSALRQKLARTAIEYLERQQASVVRMANATDDKTITANVKELLLGLGEVHTLETLVKDSAANEAYTDYQTQIKSIDRDSLKLDTQNPFESYTEAITKMKTAITAATSTVVELAQAQGLPKDLCQKLTKKDLVENESLVAITLTNLILRESYQKIAAKLKELGFDEQARKIESYITSLTKDNVPSFFKSKDVFFGQGIGDIATETVTPDTFNVEFELEEGLLVERTLQGKFESNYSLMRPTPLCSAVETASTGDAHPTVVVHRSGTNAVFKSDKEALKHCPPHQWAKLKQDVLDVRIQLIATMEDDFWTDFLSEVAKTDPKAEAILKLVVPNLNESLNVTKLSIHQEKDHAILAILIKYLFSLNRAVMHTMGIIEKELEDKPSCNVLHHCRMGAIRASDKNESEQLRIEQLLANALSDKTLKISGRKEPVRVHITYTNIPHNNGTVEAEAYGKEQLWQSHNQKSVHLLRETASGYIARLRRTSKPETIPEIEETLRLMEDYLLNPKHSSPSGSLLPLGQILEAHLVLLFNQCEALLTESPNEHHVISTHCKSGLDRTPMIANLILFLEAKECTARKITEIFERFDQSTKITGEGFESEVDTTLTEELLATALSTSHHLSPEHARVKSPQRTVSESTVRAGGSKGSLSDETVSASPEHRSLSRQLSSPVFEELSELDAEYILASLFKLTVLKDMAYWKSARFISAGKPNVVGLARTLFKLIGVSGMNYLSLGEEGAQG